MLPEERRANWGAHFLAHGSLEWDENTVIGQGDGYYDPTGVWVDVNYDVTTATEPGGSSAPVNFQAWTWAGTPANATVTFDPPSGSLGPGRHTVTCTVTYVWGPVQTITFTATANATPGPCPKDNIVVASGATTTVSLTHPALSGVQSRSLTVLDAHGEQVFTTNTSAATEHVALPVGINTVSMSGSRGDAFGSYSCAFQVAVLPSYGLPEDHLDDTDGDGIPDWLELRARTNPLDAEDRFEMRMTTAPAGMRLAWGRAGVAYQVEQGGLDLGRAAGEGESGAGQAHDRHP